MNTPKGFKRAWTVFVEWRDLPARWAVNRAVDMLRNDCGARIVTTRGRTASAAFSDKAQAEAALAILREVYDDEFVWASIMHSLVREAMVS